MSVHIISSFNIICFGLSTNYAFSAETSEINFGTVASINVQGHEHSFHMGVFIEILYTRCTHVFVMLVNTDREVNIELQKCWY